MNIYHSKIQEDLKLNRKRQSVAAKIKMTEMLELTDKDVKGAIIKNASASNKDGWNKRKRKKSLS